MLLKIISDNFRDLLDILKTKPLVVIVLSLMLLTGFFIDKWVVSKDSSIDELKDKDREIKMIIDSMYNYKYQSLYYKTLYEANIRKTDSLFIETNKIIRPIIELKK